MLLRLLIIFTMFVAYTCRESKQDREDRRLKDEKAWQYNADQDTAGQYPVETVSNRQEVQAAKPGAGDGRGH